MSRVLVAGGVIRAGRFHPAVSSVLVAAPLVAGWATHVAVLRRRLGLARRDPLTGLLTRTGWTAQAERIVTDFPQSAVLLLDLDGFKQVNDTYGHATGDRVLAVIGQRLACWCDPDGVAGRIGGDEFVAVVRSDDPRSLIVRIEQLQVQLRRPIDGLSFGWSQPVSIGAVWVASYPGQDLSGLLRRADIAMYSTRQDRPTAPAAGALQAPRAGVAA